MLKNVNIVYELAGKHGVGRVDMVEDRLVGFKSRLPQLDRAWYASEDTRLAYGNNSSVAGSHASGSARYRCLVRGWSVTPEVLMKGPGCTLRGLSMEVAEV